MRICILNIFFKIPSIASMQLSPAWPASPHTSQPALCFPQSCKKMIMDLNIILLVTFWSISSSSDETCISAFLSCALSLVTSLAPALCLPARVSPTLSSCSSAPVLVSSYFCSPAVCLGEEYQIPGQDTQDRRYLLLRAATLCLSASSLNCSPATTSLALSYLWFKSAKALSTFW